MVTELEKASFRFIYQQETAVNQSHLRPPACEEGQTASMRLANLVMYPRCKILCRKFGVANNMYM